MLGLTVFILWPILVYHVTPRKTGEWISEGVFGLFLENLGKKLLCSHFRGVSLSTECCIFVSVLTLILTNWLKETVLLTATVGPQTNIKLTAGWQRDSPTPLPIETFILDRMWKTAAFVWKTSRTEGPVMRLDPTHPPTTTPTTPPPRPQHTEGYSCYMNVLTNWKKNKVVTQN